MKKQSVGYIFQDEYPWDVRVEKFIDSLSDNGYSVHLISRNRSGLPVKEHVHDTLTIHRLPKCGSKLLRTLCNFPAFFSPFWLFKILSVIKKNKLGLLIVRDLPMAPAAYMAAKISNIPVIMDMAEDYPAMIESTWKYKGPEPLDYVIRNPYLLRKMEKLIVPLLDGVVVVSDASRKRVQGLLGNKQVPVWVVGNTPKLEVSQEHLHHDFAGTMVGFSGITVFYSGFLEEMRGLDLVIKALPLVKKQGVNIQMVIVGTGTALDGLKQQAKQLDVDQCVKFTGWIKNDYIPSMIAAADICIVPHYVTSHTNTTLPNKIYDYMAQKKPVVVTQCESLVEIVEEQECGLVYHDLQEERLAEVLVKLSDQKLREEMGLRGYQAVLSKYNWSVDRQVLIDAVNEVCDVT